MARPQPNLFVVGSMRAGTTSVYHWLSQHPDVHVTVPKEPHWFAFPDVAPDYSGPGDEQLNERIVWRRDDYDQLFAEGAAARFRTDASAMYLHLPDAMTRVMAAAGDDARFVVCLRDPVDRSVSAFAFNRMREREPLESLEEALDAEARRRAAGWSPMFWYAGASRVADEVRRLLDAVGPRTLIVTESDLDDADRAAERLFRWLELPVPPTVDTQPRNRSGDARSATVARVLAHGPVKRRLKPLLPASVRRRLEHLREANRSALDVGAQARERLRTELDDEYAALDEILGGG